MKSNQVSKKTMIKMLVDHGMSTQDFWDFYKQFGVNESYNLADIRYFLGY